jgi:hypothetical protein
VFSWALAFVRLLSLWILFNLTRVSLYLKILAEFWTRHLPFWNLGNQLKCLCREKYFHELVLSRKDSLHPVNLGWWECNVLNFGTRQWPTNYEGRGAERPWREKKRKNSVWWDWCSTCAISLQACQTSQCKAFFCFCFEIFILYSQLPVPVYTMTTVIVPELHSNIKYSQSISLWRYFKDFYLLQGTVGSTSPFRTV